MYVIKLIYILTILTSIDQNTQPEVDQTDNLHTNTTET
jgi:hypothetical protein